jgi:hypothetical protein
MLNRGALIVRPKQPYLDWAAGLDESENAPDPEGEQTVYLIPSFESDEDAEEILEDVFDEVFELELLAQDTDESTWPVVRDFATFQEWFDVELHSVVEDLCDDDLYDESE